MIDEPLTYSKCRDIALSLGLPRVEDAVSWGQPCLKAHGKLWLFWSQSEDAPVFKVPFDERDHLVTSQPTRFFFTDHYKSHKLVLMRPENPDIAWMQDNLNRVWRAMAPKRFLKAFDAGEF